LFLKIENRHNPNSGKEGGRGGKRKIREKDGKNGQTSSNVKGTTVLRIILVRATEQFGGG